MTNVPKFSVRGPFGAGFNHAGLNVVYTKENGHPVVAYRNTFKGVEYVHVRELWWNGHVWAPGKGVAFDAEQAVLVPQAISAALAGGKKPKLEAVS